MIFLLAAALALLSPAAPSSANAFDSLAFHAPVATRWQTLDQNLAPFTERFNDYSDRYRLVMLVSPT